MAILLDRIVPIDLDQQQLKTRFHNEFQVLNSWHDGLHFLYSQMRCLEKTAGARFSTTHLESDAEHSESPSSSEDLVFRNRSCCFQWYAVTLCNFVELIGAIGWELDLSRKPPRDYVKEVIPAVLDYRNKVAAHLGRARRKQANWAEQAASLLPPSSLMDGRYFAGQWNMVIRRGGTVTRSENQPWSLTVTHEELAQRYWSNLEPL